MKKIINILIGDKLFLSAFLIGSVLLICGYVIRECVPTDDITEPYQTVLISLTMTLIIYAVSRIAQSVWLFKKYQVLEGAYSCYNYRLNKESEQEEQGYYELEDKKNGSVANISYIGGERFSITVEAGEYRWTGDFVMQSDNRAEIAWWYTAPISMKYTVGYKTAVVKIKNNDVDIVIFGTDKSRFGRELLVKDSIS